MLLVLLHQDWLPSTTSRISNPWPQNTQNTDTHFRWQYVHLKTNSTRNIQTPAKRWRLLTRNNVIIRNLLTDQRMSLQKYRMLRLCAATICRQLNICGPCNDNPFFFTCADTRACRKAVELNIISHHILNYSTSNEIRVVMQIYHNHTL